jgi:hypothetical protein
MAAAAREIFPKAAAAIARLRDFLLRQQIY